ncbi:hypothetical protein V501_06260 [Pseudogymnoascus sp. VKM F-4519 (FW-2642)]|nr:hypothetical protein V501_06260 [Pseudogymnoascus sp. VKM F-4519 (FW-2642)]
MAMRAEPDVDLEGLSDVEATIDFTNPKDFTKTVQSFFLNANARDPVGDHTVLVTGYPNKWFNPDNDKSTLAPGAHKALYYHNTEILLLTMLGLPHEIAAREFSDSFIIKIDAMGCRDDIMSTGGATRSMSNISKEPDASWGPDTALPPTYYSTFILEAGASESGRALGRDAKIWLEHEESHVTQVITIKISRRRPEIVFTVWKRGREHRDTRANHPLRAVVDQQIQVTLQEGRPVADGMLRLSFEEIFERPQQLGTAEGDLTFSTRELGAIARKVWRRMGNDIE